MGTYGRNIRIMYAVRFLMSMHFMAGVLIPFFTDWGGISFAQVMVLQSYFVLAAFALEVPTGAVADTISRKASVILSAVVTAAAVIVYASTPSMAVFVVGETLWAAGHALMSGASEALVYDSLRCEEREQESKTVFARFGSMDLTAFIVSAPLGGVMASEWGLRYAMLLMAVPFMVACALSFTIAEPPAGEGKSSSSYTETLKSGIRYFRGHRVLRILAFDYIAVGPLIFFVIWMYQPMLSSLGVPITYFGFVHAGMSLAQIVVMNRFGSLERLFGTKRRFVVGCAIIPACAYLVLAASPPVPVAVAMLLLCTGFGFSRYTLFQSYFNKHIESEVRATVLSTLSMLYLLAEGVMYPVLGFLVEWSLPRTFLIFGVAVLVITAFSRIEESYLVD